MMYRVLFILLLLTGALSACAPEADTTLVDSLEGNTVEDLPPIAFYRTPDENNPNDPALFPFPTNYASSAPTNPADNDGTLNLPVDPNSPTKPLIDALNTLDGFSTTTNIISRLSSDVDLSTLLPNIVVFKLNGGLTNGVIITNGTGETLSLTMDPTADPTAQMMVVAKPNENGTTDIVLLPLRPLSPDTAYVVVLKKGIKNSAGQTYVSDPVYQILNSDNPLVDDNGNTVTALPTEEAVRLEPLRFVMNLNVARIVHQGQGQNASGIPGIDSEDQILSHWLLKTQSIGYVMNQRYADVQTGSPNLIFPNRDEGGVSQPLPLPVQITGAADVHAALLNVDYFLGDTSQSVLVPLGHHWQDENGKFLTLGSNVPVGVTKTIPVLVSIPNVGTRPDAGWPTIIFQHGITGNRSNMLALANAFAQAGFAVVAIDLPLHGIDPTDPLVGGLYIEGLERHFDLDLNDNATRQFQDNGDGSYGDGSFDGSGAHFINLANLLVSRDNVRQAVSDLFVLRKSLTSNLSDYDGVTTTGQGQGQAPQYDFDADRIYYVGHSLGGIVGATYLAYDSNVSHAVLGMASGGIMKVLDASQTFGPIIAGGLAQNGLEKGSASYEGFMTIAQTMVDSVDPINHMAATRNGRGILLYEVVGDATHPADLVVPNTAPDRKNNDTTTVGLPLSGTDIFGTLLFLGTDAVITQTDLDAAAPKTLAANSAWVRLNRGHHSSLVKGSLVENDLPPYLQPYLTAVNDQANEVVAEVIPQMVGYFSLDGAALPITAPTLYFVP